MSGNPGDDDDQTGSSHGRKDQDQTAGFRAGPHRMTLVASRALSRVATGDRGARACATTGGRGARACAADREQGCP